MADVRNPGVQTLAESIDAAREAAAAKNGGVAVPLWVAVHGRGRKGIAAAVTRRIPEAEWDEQATAALVGPGEYLVCIGSASDHRVISAVPWDVGGVAMRPLDDGQGFAVPRAAAAAAASGGGVDSTALLVAMMQQQAQQAGMMFQAMQQQSSTMMGALASMVRERSVERTPIDEALRLAEVIGERVERAGGGGGGEGDGGGLAALASMLVPLVQQSLQAPPAAASRPVARVASAKPPAAALAAPAAPGANPPPVAAPAVVAARGPDDEVAEMIAAAMPGVDPVEVRYLAARFVTVSRVLMGCWRPDGEADAGDTAGVVLDVADRLGIEPAELLRVPAEAAAVVVVKATGEDRPEWVRTVWEAMETSEAAAGEAAAKGGE